jgi:hypothetical protein
MKRYLSGAATILIALAASAGISVSATSARDVTALAKATYIYIATVRKDGNQSRAVPVWFITTSDNQVLIQTGPTSWKAKRIKRGSPALIWIGERTGPAFIGKAEIVQDKTLQDQVLDQYPKKYLLARIGFARPSRDKIDSGKIVVIRITPTRDLPDGFESAPGTPAPTLEAPAKK